MLLVILAGVKQAWASLPTTTTLTVTAGGSAVTTVPALTVIQLTATVKAGSTPITPGQVNFCDATATYCTDIHVLGTAQLTSAGTAVMKFRPGIGTHSYKAVFLGTTTNATSSSGNSALTVKATNTGDYATTTALAQSMTGGAYTLTATVAGSVAIAGQPSPSGSISFLDTNNGNNVLGTAALPADTRQLGWTTSQTIATPVPGVWGEVAEDFNGDGIADLAVFGNSGNSLSIFLGNGDGTFTPGPVLQATGGTVAFASGDFNGDGKMDLVVLTDTTVQICCHWPPKYQTSSALTILLGNGDGTFTPTAGPTMGQETWAVTVGDFNGDGVPDLVVGEVGIFLGNGNGTFRAALSLPVSGGETKVADFNGDGKLDLALVTGGMTILLGNGDGTFTAMPDFAVPGGDWGPGGGGVVVADFNRDGKADLACSGGAVFLGNGDGTFTAEPGLQLPPFGGIQIGPYSIVVGDFSGNGIPDLADIGGPNIYSLANSSTLTFFTGNGDGTFTALAKPVKGTGFFTAVVADFNGDGRPDIAIGDGASGSVNITVLLTGNQTAIASASGIALAPNTGTHLVEAEYSGDSNYSPSVSGTTGLITTGVVSISTPSLAFGNEPVNDSTPSQNVMVTNTGVVSLSIKSIKMTGANPTSYVTSNTCGASLAVGATCRFGVRFAPRATGAANAAVTLTDSAADSPQSVPVSGTGITPGVASLSRSATSLAFGDEAVESSTGSQNVTVTNTSSTTLYFKTITLGGTNASSFVTSNTCGGSLGGTLAPGAQCRIGVRFVPAIVGPLTATITLTDNAADSPQSVTVSGTGITPGVASLRLSASSLTFGEATVGSSTESQNVTVTNTSSTTLYFKTITLGGTNASSFVTGNTCGAGLGGSLGGSLAPGAQCRIGVRLAPTVGGPLTATITLTNNAADSPETIMLTGAGQ